MEVVTLDSGVGNAAIRAAGVLRSGGVILYPTDTVYGLGADALSDEAVEKVYTIKGRELGKPMHCIVADLTMAAEYVVINDIARRLAEKFLPGPLTMILKKREGIDGGIARGMDTIGIRIPNSEFCLDLARSFGGSYVSTSANRSGSPTEEAVDKIIAQLGDKAAEIDLIIDGIQRKSLPSTVVNVVSGHLSILRQGAIPAAQILAIGI